MDLSLKEANPAYGAYDQCCESVRYVSQGVLRWTLLCMFKHLNKPNFPFFSSLLLHKMDLLYVFFLFILFIAGKYHCVEFLIAFILKVQRIIYHWHLTYVSILKL